MAIFSSKLVLSSIVLICFLFPAPAVSTGIDHCEGTLYPELCVSTLSAIPDIHAKSLPDVICATIKASKTAVNAANKNCSIYLRHHSYTLDGRQRYAITDCLDLFSQTLNQLSAAWSHLSRGNASSRVEDVRTVLSAAITNQYTCLDGFAYVGHDGGYRQVIEGRLYHVSHMISNSLAMVRKIPRKVPRRREALDGYGSVDAARGFPEWVSKKDRRLLQAATNETSVDLVVAKDGSGNFTTVSEAVAAAPNNSKQRFVIYVKAGTYLENVEVPMSKKNLMLMGDEIRKTVIKASRNVVDGWTTFRSATVAVVGDGFLMRDVTVENSAGPSKHQAVALRVGADLSAFHRCSFVGNQDTLYVHSLRQFFYDCDVYGTIDFIFGNSAVVLQKCRLYARRPLPGQQNFFTAQAREDPNQNTGISVHRCQVKAAADLLPVQSSFLTYLGRPWREYSRTVFMKSFLDSLIDPAGWSEWDGSFALSTLFYGEYKNSGPGATTTGRVKWPGYRIINSSTEAKAFTVKSFIEGDQWLTSVPFLPGLA
ncbi:pectinesterase-like [Zingiber officinale]|uniref:pectinesterase-like n=1 Tax=Zingiber officinale TaxID=94328 RepID=UPI001C4CF33D|nr:pectinesterase-like [Zingiber officinale]